MLIWFHLSSVICTSANLKIRPIIIEPAAGGKFGNWPDFRWQGSDFTIGFPKTDFQDSINSGDGLPGLNGLV